MQRRLSRRDRTLGIRITGVQNRSGRKQCVPASSAFGSGDSAAVQWRSGIVGRTPRFPCRECYRTLCHRWLPMAGGDVSSFGTVRSSFVAGGFFNPIARAAHGALF